MNWHIDSIPLCRKSIAFCYGFSENKLRAASSKFDINSTSQLPLGKTRDWDDSTFFDDVNFDTIEEIFEGNGISIDERELLQASLLRSSSHFGRCFAFMENKFSLFESQPNSKQIHMDVDKKRRIYKEYKEHIQSEYGTEQPVLAESQFRTMWSSCFDHVKIRETKRVSGKCWTCAHINTMRHETSDVHTLEALKQLMIMHRGGLFMLERIQYKRRVYEAVKVDPQRIMSSITDGASSNHVHIPHVGPNQQMSPAFEQHLQGVLNHGRDFVLYRTFPHVPKSADLVIFCLLNELERWYHEHNCLFPETWYIQVDGGSENANKYVLACLEYLVTKRMVRKIYLTRLPVGHTHEVSILNQI